MSVQQFTRTDPEQNVHRWYAIYCGPTLFDTWAVVRSLRAEPQDEAWGRIGSNRSQHLVHEFPTPDLAHTEAQAQADRRLKRGYVPTINDSYPR